MELINEAFVLVTNYHLFTFTDFLSDIEVRQQMGTSLIVTTVFNLLINLGVISGVTLALSARKLKLRYLKWKQDQEIKKAKEHQLWLARCQHIAKKFEAYDRKKRKEEKAKAKAKKRIEKLKRREREQENEEEAQLDREIQ